MLAAFSCILCRMHCSIHFDSLLVPEKTPVMEYCAHFRPKKSFLLSLCVYMKCLVYVYFVFLKLYSFIIFLVLIKEQQMISAS